MFDDLKEEFVGKVEEPHEGSGHAPLNSRSLNVNGKERQWYLYESCLVATWAGQRRLEERSVSKLSEAQDVPESENKMKEFKICEHWEGRK